jgi:hypothetical protein
VDPSQYDLRLLYAGAQWTLAEPLALSPGISGEEASRLVVQVQLPVGGLVEVLEGRHLVHGDLTVPEEALVLLMNLYPTPSPSPRCARRWTGAVQGAWTTPLRPLEVQARPPVGDGSGGFDRAGHARAITVAQANAE